MSRELLRRVEPAERRDRQRELGARRRGLAAERAGRIGGVLLLHRVADVADGDPELRHPVGVELDGHGEVEPAEDGGVADAVDALDLVLDVELRVVGEISRVVAGVGRW